MAELPLNEIKDLIAASKLLNALEKKYWVENLKVMTPPQLKKLVEILGQAQSSTWDEKLTKLIGVLTSAAQKFTLTTK